MDPNLARLYEIAVEQIERPERDQAAVAVIAHCVVEIADRLADRLGQVEGFVLPPNVETSAAVSNLAVAWETEGLPLGDAPSVSGGHQAGELIEGIENGLIPKPPPMYVTARVYDAAEAVVIAHAKAVASVRQRHAVVAVGTVGTADDPTARLLDVTIDYFKDYRHLSQAMQRPELSADELDAQFGTFETIIYARRGGFYAVVDDLSEILKATNTRQSDLGSEAVYVDPGSSS